MYFCEDIYHLILDFCSIKSKLSFSHTCLDYYMRQIFNEYVLSLFEWDLPVWRRPRFTQTIDHNDLDAQYTYTHAILHNEIHNEKLKYYILYTANNHFHINDRRYFMLVNDYLYNIDRPRYLYSDDMFDKNINWKFIFLQTICSTNCLFNPSVISSHNGYINSYIYTGAIIPEVISNNHSLKGSRIQHREPMGISSIPKSLYKLELTNFSIRNDPCFHKKIKSIPSTLGNMISLRKLCISGNSLTEIPPCIFTLINLTRLYFNGNFIKKIPTSISKLTKLRKLNLSRNLISHIPQELCQLNDLERLLLIDNPIQYISPYISKLTVDWIEISSKQDLLYNAPFHIDSMTLVRGNHKDEEGGIWVYKSSKYMDKSKIVIKNNVKYIQSEHSCSVGYPMW